MKRPVASSLATDVYRQLPNYTDVNNIFAIGAFVFRGLGFGDFGRALVRAAHGDSSGVRGAAWLWEAPGDRSPVVGIR